MKLVDRILNYIEDFEQKCRFSIQPAALVSVFFVFWLIHRGRERLGDFSPNPINIFNHIGNVDSVIPALIAGFLAGFICSKTLYLTRKQLLCVGILTGVFIGLVCNVLIELPFGMNLLNEPNVADPLDVVWGTTFCLVACLATFKVRDKK